METVIPAIGGLISYGAGKRTDIQSTCRKYQYRKLRGKGEGIIRVRRKPILFERYILSTRRIHIYIYMYVRLSYCLPIVEGEPNSGSPVIVSRTFRRGKSWEESSKA